MSLKQCPCCGYFTIDSDDEVIVDICAVCFWQYDIIAHENPDKAIGPNHELPLNQAIINFKTFKACDKKFISKVRDPYPEEYPTENLAV